MSPPTLNFVVDAILFALILAVLFTGTAIHLVFPPGTHAAGWSLWGWGYDRWSTAHFASLCVLAVAILIHVLLHWVWVINFITSRVGRWQGRRIDVPDSVKTIYGVGTLIAVLCLLGGLLAVATITVRGPP